MKRYEGENPPRESFFERVYGDLAADSLKINFHVAIVCLVDSERQTCLQKQLFRDFSTFGH